MNLLERIDRWAVAMPGAIAHISGSRNLTFGELTAHSNALAAHFLKSYGDDDRAPIAVLGHREPEMLVAFLGVAKSGRPYVPIDTGLPHQRIQHILSIAKPSLLLTPEEIARLSNIDLPVPRFLLHPYDPFYIMFTSGSSGTPKGIVITLGCLEHFVGWMLSEHQFVENDEIFLNQAPFSFDLSVIDLYCSLVTGSTLFSISRDVLANPRLLYRTLAESNITTWVSTPSFAEMCLVERTFNRTMLQRLRRFLFCGETLLPATVSLLFERFPAAEIWNLYGPTEATVATTSVRIDRDIWKKYSSMPVGRPMPGTDLFLVDENRSRVPPGSRGEIVIKGPNVSPGYLASADLTATHFFEENGQRSYRTGDWGTFRDGLLFFDGRVDSQIKLTGYRIELGDLEANLRALPIVRDAAVIPVVKDGKVQWLAAFVVPSADSTAAEQSLEARVREGLRQRLPPYMLPRKFIVIDAFPLTANGKVDRQKLAKSL